MKKFLSLALALIMALSLVTVSAGAVEFSDAEEITQVEAVGVMAGLGILEGSDGAFNPTGTLTRGAAAKIITYMLEGTVKAEAIKAAGVKESSFPDVPATSANAAFIEYCAQKGIITGYSNGNFDRKGTLTGKAFLKMVLKALGDETIDFNSKTNPAWPIDAAALAVEMEIIEDDFDLEGYISREDACALALEAVIYAPTEGTGYVLDNLDTVNFPTLAALADKVYANKTDAILEIMALAAGAVYGDDYTIEDAPATGSLGEKNWGLTPDTRTDGFGRVTDTWTNGVADITAKTYVEYAAFEREPVKVITTALADAAALKTALGYKTADHAKAAVGDVVVDGVPGTRGVFSATGNGVVVEAYKAEKVGTVQYYDLVVINTYTTTLTADNFVEADETNTIEKAAHIWINLDGDSPAAEDEGETIVADGLKAGDFVLYTKGANGLESIEKATTMSGKVTAVAGDNSYIRVGGEKYVLSALAVSTSISAGDVPGFFYTNTTDTWTYTMDRFGNIISATTYSPEAAEIETNYVYIFAGASMVDAGTGLLDASDSYAEAQVKVYDLATGEIGIKNLAVVKNSSGVWKYADTEGKATATSVGNDSALFTGVYGLYKYYEMEDGTIVLVDYQDNAAAPATVAATTAGISIDDKKADITSTLTATSATTFTVFELTSSSGKITAGTSKTYTGIANFPDNYNSGSTISAIVTEEDGIVSNILYVVVNATTTSSVKFATYKGVGEVIGGVATHSFYVKGEVVDYKLASGVTVSLTAGDIVDLTLTDGKISTSVATSPNAKSPDATGKVTFIDDTFVIIDTNGDTDGGLVVKYFASSYTVVDKDASYAIDELAIGDNISIYETSTKTAFVVIDN